MSHDNFSPDDDRSKQKVPDVTFLNYITSLAMQSLIFLGVVEHPVTRRVDKNLKQAKFLIDTLFIIKDKTQGNLTEEEDQYLKRSTRELQIKYLELTQESSDE